MTEDEWYEKFGVTHAHCPRDCGEHPQPRMQGNDLVCGRCLIIFNEISIMIPCTPEVCE